MLLKDEVLNLMVRSAATPRVSGRYYGIAERTMQPSI
jgi:hypothetical protein